MLFFLSTLCILRGELPFSAFRKPGTTFALESMANATDRFSGLSRAPLYNNNFATQDAL